MQNEFGESWRYTSDVSDFYAFEREIHMYLTCNIKQDYSDTLKLQQDF